MREGKLPLTVMLPLTTMPSVEAKPSDTTSGTLLMMFSVPLSVISCWIWTLTFCPTLPIVSVTPLATVKLPLITEVPAWSNSVFAVNVPL